MNQGICNDQCLHDEKSPPQPEAREKISDQIFILALKKFGDNVCADVK